MVGAPAKLHPSAHAATTLELKKVPDCKNLHLCSESLKEEKKKEEKKKKKKKEEI